MKSKGTPLKIVWFAIMISLMLFPLTADAITTNLTYSNVDLGVSGIFAVVSVSVTNTTAAFSVDANESLLGAGSNFGIQVFGFNSAVALSAADFALPIGWSVGFGSNLSEFGLFYSDAHGTGSNRQDPLVFSITNSQINSEAQFYVANADGCHYAAHIAGFSELRGQTSAWFADDQFNVPEPATMLLLGFGLIGVAGLRRK